MPTNPAAVQNALNILKEAYRDECHLAADAVVTRVHDGAITSDDELWTAIVDTHQARVTGDALTPSWSPILFSEYRFDAPPITAGAPRESDLLWECSRTAWVVDVCHILREHHGMSNGGATRSLFLASSPLDSLSNQHEVAQRAILELRRLVGEETDRTLQEKLTRQITRLETATRPLNPSPFASEGR